MLEKYAYLRVLERITGEPNAEFSVRQLAAESGVSPAVAMGALKYMLAKGIVLRKIVGRSHLYRADVENALCRQWKVVFNLERLQNSGIIGKLGGAVKALHCLLLYGSCGRGTNDEKSDIDLLAISHSHARIGPEILRAAEREVNLSILTLREWRKKAKDERVFYENVIYDSIVLLGTRPVVL